jgi:ribose transport system permease protein
MNKQKIKNILQSYGIVIVLLLLIIFFSVMSDRFLTMSNIFNILRQVSIVGIAAVGMTFVLITGGIDLSVGSIIGVAGVGAAELMLIGVPPIVACLIMLVISTALGFLNAVFINKLLIPPLIVTLATMGALRGLAYIITGGLPVFGFDPSFGKLGQGTTFGIPTPILVMAAVFIVGIIFINKTRFGRYIYGVGGNEEAARLSGINTDAVRLIVYSISGFLSGIAGLVMLSRINSGQPNAGSGYEMDVITAVVLGGVSINGGEGKLGLVIVGVLIMGVLTTGMIMLNINDYVQQVVKGLVLIAAVGFDRLSQAKKSKIVASEN